jgi:phosphohistidine swiveling domain-containing protein
MHKIGGAVSRAGSLIGGAPRAAVGLAVGVPTVLGARSYLKKRKERKDNESIRNRMRARMGLR